MSHSLFLNFEPSVSLRRIVQYFAARKYFTIDKDVAYYRNPDTKVYFHVQFFCTRDLFLRRQVASVEFEVNYSRPSYFGLEAEQEASALVAAFAPRIGDPQIDGMDEGPYSREGYLKGWNFGNAFSISKALAMPDFQYAAMPAEALRAAWTWNYALAALKEKSGARCDLRSIGCFRIDGRACRVAFWANGRPTILPCTEYVALARSIDHTFCYGLVTWAAAMDAVKRAGYDTIKQPIDVGYLGSTPPAIEDLFANMPLIDFGSLERLAWDRIFDDEAIVAARKRMEKDRVIYDG